MARDGEAVLIVQLSDLHFNERVDLPSNRYDFKVAAARLAKLAARVKQIGRCYGARKVVIACLGDFLNSSVPWSGVTREEQPRRSRG